MKKRTKSLIALGFLIILAFGFFAQETDFDRAKNYYGEWELVLVNYDNRVPKNWESEFVTLTCGEKVDERIYPDLQRMFDDALSEGVDLIVRSGFRSEEEQERVLENKIEAYKKEGHSKKIAERLARDTVSLPGKSEHQLGIAVDINGEGKTKNQEAYSWLKDNAYKYGFIERYAADKVSETHIDYEPWHYRYVGSYAEEIYESGVCLEEFVG